MLQVVPSSQQTPAAALVSCRKADVGNDHSPLAHSGCRVVSENIPRENLDRLGVYQVRKYCQSFLGSMWRSKHESILSFKPHIHLTLWDNMWQRCKWMPVFDEIHSTVARTIGLGPLSRREIAKYDSDGSDNHSVIPYSRICSPQINFLNTLAKYVPTPVYNLEYKKYDNFGDDFDYNNSDEIDDRESDEQQSVVDCTNECYEIMIDAETGEDRAVFPEAEPSHKVEPMNPESKKKIKSKALSADVNVYQTTFNVEASYSTVKGMDMEEYELYALQCATEDFGGIVAGVSIGIDWNQTKQVFHERKQAFTTFFNQSGQSISEDDVLSNTFEPF